MLRSINAARYLTQKMLPESDEPEDAAVDAGRADEDEVKVDSAADKAARDESKDATDAMLPGGDDSTALPRGSPFSRLRAYYARLGGAFGWRYVAGGVANSSARVAEAPRGVVASKTGRISRGAAERGVRTLAHASLALTH